MTTLFPETMTAVETAIVAAPVKHLDETGFRIGGKTCWMHVTSTDTLTHYRAEEKRGSLPKTLQGTVVHDHWKPYCAPQAHKEEVRMKN